MKQQEIFDDFHASNNNVVNIASVPQLSPFRYPGGKTWFVPRLREWLKHQARKPQLFIEPFAGGGISSLTAVNENLVESALLAELDDDVAAVWHVITKGNANWLADRILKFDMNHENALSEINKPQSDTKSKAFKTLLKNRCNHGGILAAGAGFLKKGESGKGVLSRWYPETLAKRLRLIDLMHTRIDFRETDAFEIIKEYRPRADAVFFIDPPYTLGGKKAGNRLYKHYLIDHELLFEMCSMLEGDFIMTYDNSEEALVLAEKYNFQVRPISMKNTHHAKLTELVIGRDLTWMNNIQLQLEKKLENDARDSIRKKPSF